MIKINLLLKPPPRIRWRRVLIIGLSAGLLGVVGLGLIDTLTAMTAQNRGLSESESLLADYRQAAGRLPALQSRLDELTVRQSQVDQLGQKQRQRQSLVLQEVLLLPPGVSITRVMVQQGQVTVVGRATSFGAAMEYLAYLRRSALFDQVTERELQTTPAGPTTFTYSARLREGVKGP